MTLLCATVVFAALGALAVDYHELRDTGAWLLASSFAALALAAALMGLVVALRAQAATYRRQYDAVAARAQTEQALAQTQSLLNALLDFAPAPIHVTSPPGTYLMVNAAWEAASGINRTAAIARRHRELFPPDAAREFEESDRLVAETGSLLRREQTVEQQGAIHHFETVKFPIRDETGAVRAVAGISVDVTERKRAEEHLHQETAQLRALLHIAGRLASTLDPASVLDTVCRETAEALSVEAVNIKLFKDGLLHHASSYGMPPEWIEADTAVPIEEYLAAVEPDGHAIWPDVLHSGSVSVQDLYRRFDIRSVMGVMIRTTGQRLGTISVYARGKRRDFRAEDLALLRGVANLAATALSNARLFEETVKQAERLRVLAARLSEAEERERGRLARELHDQVGQNLTALGVSLSMATLDVEQGRPSEVLGRLATAQDMLTATAKSIRDVLYDLRPPVLDDFGLVAALQAIGARLETTAGIRVVVEGPEPVPRLASPIAGVLHRIAQEALNNAVKHARATTIRVTVSAAERMVSMNIADDGCGFDRAAHAVGERPSWGLALMEERAHTIGASLRIESNPGSGTRVTVEAPR
jgi:PAS domain S-box-containing protein